MMKKIIVVLLMVFLPLVIHGQIPEPVKNRMTPNASSLGTYGNIPVSLYTGQPDISIPLYELTDGDLKVPIGLSYQLSAVKPNVRSGWVGIGWSMHHGGHISRSVKGCMDEKQCSNGYSPGFYANRGKLNNIRTREDLAQHQTFYMEDIETNAYELSADEFTFNFCGYSGRFYLNKEGGWTVISDAAIKVDFKESDGFITQHQLRPEIKTENWSYKSYCDRFFNRFTLITPDGVKYTFGGKYATEYSISYYSRNSSDLIPTTWYLSRIESLEGRIIEFTYEAGNPICEIKHTPHSVRVNNIACDNGNSITSGRGALSGYLLFPVYLKAIESTLARVNFVSVRDVWEENPNKDFLAFNHLRFNTYEGYPAISRVDEFKTFFNISKTELNEVRKALSEAMAGRQLYAVCIQQKGETMEWEDHKTYYFEYSNFSKKTSHKLLALITERQGGYKEYVETVSGGGATYFVYKIPPAPHGYMPKDYRFGYYLDRVIPQPVYAFEDHWGYFNGASLVFGDTTEKVILKKGANEECAKAETLKEIHYPTGGSTLFEYELNDFSQKVAPDFISLIPSPGRGGGLRVSRMVDRVSEGTVSRIKKYHYVTAFATGAHPSGQSSGILKSDSVYVTRYFSDDQPKYWIPFEGVTNSGTASLCLTHSGGFTASPLNDTSPIIGYSSVYEELLDADGNSLGYTHYRYSNYDRSLWGVSHLDSTRLFSTADGESYAQQFSSRSQERGKLLSEDYYDKDNRKVKSVQYKYDKVWDDKNKDFTAIHQQAIFFCTDVQGFTYAIFSSAFRVHVYSWLLSEKIETLFYDDGRSTQEKTGYAYTGGKLLGEEHTENSGGEKYLTRYRYSSDLARKGIHPYVEMRDIHILNAPVEQSVIKDGYVVRSSHAEYRFFSPTYKPYRLYTLLDKPNLPASALNNPTNLAGNVTSPLYEWEKEFSYDRYGNVVSVKGRDDSWVTYLWGYANRYPVAEIRNATPEEVGLVTSNSTFSSAPSPLVMRSIRQQLPKAHIEAYTYKPLVGISTYTNALGYTTYYEYDKLGRLLRVRDPNGKIILGHEYHYKASVR